ncbi:MAG: FKBP-type peptidyl-prolyl cis-trans isomerase [Fimbriimonadaceae bacterium]|nr:FKBP-type peptidyl-prolyl cis-trans isomerase [Fimbriimonadaceae bacterium]
MLPLLVAVALGLPQAPQAPRVNLGDRVTIHFTASLTDGRNLADSERRGLPYTFVVGTEPLVRPFDLLVRGMAVGEEKVSDVAEEEAFGAGGVPPIVPPHAALKVRIKLLRLVRPAPPGVESRDAE